jgi:serine/threonine-protein kinase
MAPEQIRGASKVDERADVYAFAMVAFEALSGRLAYDASGSIALIACKLEKPARSIRDLGRMPIPQGLDALLTRCLARRPADRPASAAELLREWRTLGPATVAPSPLAPGMELGEHPTEAGLTAAPTLMTRAAKPGSRLGLLVAGGALVASCAVLVAGLSLRAPTPPVAAAATAAEPLAAPAPSPAPPPTTDPAPDPTAAQLDMPPVTLAGSAGPPDAGAPSRGSRGRPGKRIGTQAAGAPARRAPTEPQIVNEPRY